MTNVYVFRPRALVDFEGAALAGIARMSDTLLRTAAVLEMPELDADTHRKVLKALQALVARFELVERALEDMEARAPALIRKLKAGECRTFDTANDESTMSVTMTASPRGAVLYVSEMHFEQVSIRMQARRVRVGSQ